MKYKVVGELFKMENNNYDFGGYATRNDVICTDGRTIRKNAFIENDGMTVPLVWQHNHDSPENVLGHGLLENREDGVYVYGKFNDTEMGRNAKELVKHGDMTRLSIYANRLKENNKNVIHGNIREVSLVYSGANDGAYIDTIAFSHSDSDSVDEAIIYSGDDLSMNVSHKDSEKESKTMSEEKRTIQDVINGMTEEQKNVLYYMVEQALEKNNPDDIKHGDDNMKYNIFEGKDDSEVISHMEALKSDTKAIFADAKRCGSLRDSFIAHAESGSTDTTPSYGIEDLEVFFPDYKNVSGEPNVISRDMEWVGEFLGKVKKTPFSRIKTLNVDITGEDARALGYKKGKYKKEEVVLASKRTTDPTTIYKKQKFDRDDIIDITDWNVVSFIKGEMRTMLNEETARAMLLGDGRSASDDDHIDHMKIRSIYEDHPLFTARVSVGLDSSDPSSHGAAFIDRVIETRKKYKGSGTPTLFTTEDFLAKLRLIKDDIGHYLYKSVTELETVLRVSKIVTVPVMDDIKKIADSEMAKLEGYELGTTYNLIAILVNPMDYRAGADKGGEINFFDDFDIDYNQQKYLIETRMSGALVKPHSAIVYESFDSSAKSVVG